MAKRDSLARILALVGTVLIWFPILAPVLLSVTFILQTQRLRFDYLLPAELFPFALTGGLLLNWAAKRARAREKLIIWGFIIAVALLMTGQAIAIVTGLASGEIEPTGLWWVLVLGSINAYSLALIAVGVGGSLLLRDLFKVPPIPTERR